MRTSRISTPRPTPLKKELAKTIENLRNSVSWIDSAKKKLPEKKQIGLRPKIGYKASPVRESQ